MMTMCRIRKHNCKHIRLVLTQLDIAQSPGDWKQVCPRHCFACLGAPALYTATLVDISYTCLLHSSHEVPS